MSKPLTGSVCDCLPALIWLFTTVSSFELILIIYTGVAGHNLYNPADIVGINGVFVPHTPFLTHPTHSLVIYHSAVGLA